MARKKFDELRKRMSPEARKRADELSARLLAEMPLHELRQARALTQEKLARTLGVNQASVSKLERRTDMYLSTLRSYIAAMGGVLEIIATFPEGSIRIEQFAELDEQPGRRAAKVR
ncbi:MAG: XRE family transcriptional regulator [Gemmatimonadales bacterium]|jgi:transcriptional regulator with XRE-family HTH domain